MMWVMYAKSIRNKLTNSRTIEQNYHAESYSTEYFNDIFGRDLLSYIIALFTPTTDTSRSSSCLLFWLSDLLTKSLI